MNIDKETTASFDVDVQNGFTELCPEELPVKGGHQVVGPLNAQAALCRIRVGSKDAHSAHADFVNDTWPRHCEVGTFGFELVDSLPKPDDYDYFVWKGVEKHLHPYGACYHNEDWKNRKLSTGVIEFLKYNKIKTIIVGGLATDYCVANTALQLKDADFEVIVNLAACRGINAYTTKAAIAKMLAAGVNVVADVTSF
jgi:nicotinamidase/pyrazinamidase